MDAVGSGQEWIGLAWTCTLSPSPASRWSIPGLCRLPLILYPLSLESWARSQIQVPDPVCDHCFLTLEKTVSIILPTCC